MSSLINMPFAFNREELKDLSKVIGERFYNHPLITDIHAVEQGIKYDQQIVFSGKLGLLGKQSAGCTPAAASGLTFTEKTWTPKDFSFRLTHCTADVDVQNKLLRQFKKMNPDFYAVLDSIGMNDLAKFLVYQTENALLEDIIYKSWWSDTAAGAEFNGSIDLDHINAINGLWKQIETEITGSNYVNIAKNAELTYAAQALAAGEGKSILRSMYKAADARLIGDPNAMFLVTRSIFENYTESLQDIQGNGGVTKYLESGVRVSEFEGIPVISMSTIWDVFIKKYMDNGSALHTPHRALLTTKDNIPLGTVNVDDFNTLEAFYDRMSKTNVIDGAYNLDAKLLENYMTVAAY